MPDPTPYSPTGVQAADRFLGRLVDGSFVLTDGEGTVTRWSRRAEALFGWSPSVAVGRPLLDTLVVTHEQPPVAGELETSVRHRDGREFPVSLFFVPVPMSRSLEFMAFLENVGAARTPEAVTQRIETHDHGVVEWIEGVATGEVESTGEEMVAGAIVAFEPLVDAPWAQPPEPPAGEVAEPEAEPPADAPLEETLALRQQIEDALAAAEEARARAEEAEQTAAGLRATLDGTGAELEGLKVQVASTEAMRRDIDELRQSQDALRTQAVEAAAHGAEAGAASSLLESVRALADDMRSAVAEVREEAARAMQAASTAREAADAAAEGARAAQTAVAAGEATAAAASESAERAASSADSAAVEAKVARVQAEAARVHAEESGGRTRTAPTSTAAPRKPASEDVPQREPRAGFDDADHPIAVIGLDGRFCELNPGFCELVGYSERDFKSAAWPPVTDRKNLAKHREELRALLAGEVDSVDVNTGYMHAHGLVVPVVGTLSVVPGDDGEPSHLVLETRAPAHA